MKVIQFIISADEEALCLNHGAWIEYVNSRIRLEMVEMGYLSADDDTAPFDIEVNVIPDVKQNIYVIRAFWKGSL